VPPPPPASDPPAPCLVSGNPQHHILVTGRVHALPPHPNRAVWFRGPTVRPTAHQACFLLQRGQQPPPQVIFAQRLRVVHLLAPILHHPTQQLRPAHSQTSSLGPIPIPRLDHIPHLILPRKPTMTQGHIQAAIPTPIP